MTDEHNSSSTQQSFFFFPNRLQNRWGEENDQVSREEHEGVDRQATEGPVWHSKTDLGDNNHLDQTRKKRVLKTCSGVVEKRGKWHTNCPSFFPSLGARWRLRRRRDFNYGQLTISIIKYDLDSFRYNIDDNRHLCNCWGNCPTKNSFENFYKEFRR